MRQGPQAPLRRLARVSSHVHRPVGSSSSPTAAAAAPAAAAAAAGAGPGGGALHSVLIANRGVAALRVIQAASELGIRTVAVYDDEEDAESPHRWLCDRAFPLPRHAAAASSPYLDAEAIVARALEAGVDCVHPGYGFLAESAAFSRRCEAAGLVLVGPGAQALEVFGDKTRARRLAASLAPPVPTLAGSAEAFDSAEEAFDFVVGRGLSGRPLMLKAAHGGGGRGLRRLPAGATRETFLAAFKRCASEVAGAFGASGVFVEELLERCRHVEVQVVADRRGTVGHLFERDCSVQLGRGSKVVETCPAVGLQDVVRTRILDDAVRVISATPGGYCGVGTVEFLVAEPEREGVFCRYFFIEVNPRLQVEHGVTEEVCGVDIVKAQFRLAAGEALRNSLDLPDLPDADGGAAGHALVSRAQGWAVEGRVCLTAPPDGAQVGPFRGPGGPGVRAESAVHAGSRPSGRYDPLLALVIGTGWDLETALQRATRALGAFWLGGVETNLGQLQKILRSSELRQGAALTTTTAWHSAPGARLGRFQGSEVDLETSTAPSGGVAASDAAAVNIVRAPVGGLLRWEVADGQRVRQGEAVAVVLAMKMETLIEASLPGRVVFRAPDGAELRVGDVVAALEEVGEAAEVEAEVDLQGKGGRRTAGAKWRAGVAERARRGAEALKMGGEDALAQRRTEGRFAVRDRILALVDAGSFREAGPVAGAAGPGGRMTPANFVLGLGRIGGRPVVVGGEDFTIRGGSPNLGGLQKSVFCERYALQLRVPLVRLHEGGGGAVSGGQKLRGRPRPSPAMGEPTRFGSVADCLGLLPVATAALGAVAGLPASRLVAAHFVVAVRGAQVLVAGPKVAENATGRRLSKDELGGEAVHGESGVVDNYADGELEALEQIRLFLSYLPSNVGGLPPFEDSPDPQDRREEELSTIVPDGRGPYDMRQLIRLVVDRLAPAAGGGHAASSFFELGTCVFGQEIITGLARLAGQPVGVFTNDPARLGGAMTWQASAKTRRFIEFCVTFHLPIVTFVDQPGFMVGLDAEKAGTIRFGTAAVLAAATAPVPWAAVHVRKAYGVAAAAHFGPDAHVLLWPSAESGALPVEAGVEVMYRRELAAAPPGERRRLQRHLVEVHSEQLSPWPAVESFSAMDLIDPRDTRRELCEWVAMARLRLPQLLGPATFPYRC